MTKSGTTNQSDLPNFPKAGRIAGVDFGTVRIGVAISDSEQMFSSPFENYNRRNERLDAQFFIDLSKTERVVGWVVGLPVHMSGDESEKSREVRKFAKWLHETTGLPIAFYDERFTSAIANEYMQQANLSKKKRKERLDKLAAQILLANYLESNRNSNPPGSIEDGNEFT